MDGAGRAGPLGKICPDMTGGHQSNEAPSRSPVRLPQVRDGPLKPAALAILGSNAVRLSSSKTASELKSLNPWGPQSSPVFSVPSLVS